jgi:hypothetical protein
MVLVNKTDLEGFLSVRAEVGLDGEFLWPHHPLALARLYRASPEHGRAIHVKSESAFGGGLIGDHDALDELCDGGSAELFTLLGLDLETYGNAFLQVIWSNDGQRILRLRRLPAISMSRYRAGYLQRTTKANGEIKKTTFTAREIVHLREPCPEGRHYALPTWIGGQGMLELAHAATRYNASFFNNNAVPEYVVKFKGAMPSKDQKAAIQSFFSNEMRGVENAHRTLVVSTPEDGDIEFEKLTADMKDGDFLKLIDAARDRMPVAHGVPPRMLGIMTAGQLGGGGEVSGQLFTFEHLTLKPKRRRMLDQLRPVLKVLGLKRGNADAPLGDNEIAFRPLDLTPPKDDTENLAELVGAEILDRDEARALLPHLANAAQSGSAGAGSPIERSAPQGPLEVLAALLART